MLIPKPVHLGRLAWSRFRSPVEVISGLNEITQCYGLHRQWKYIPKRTGDNSRVVILADKKNLWLLKQYRDEIEPSAIRFTHSVLSHLESSGFPSPRLKKTIDGQDFLNHNDHHYALFDHIPGFRYIDYLISRSLMGQFINQAAATLACYHRIITDVLPDGSKHEGYQTYHTKRRWDDYSWHRDEWVRLCRTDIKGRNGTKLVSKDNASRIENLFNVLVDDERDNPLLPVTVIHGDYGPYNLLFESNGKLQAVLDFDKSRFEERMEEVATSLLRFAGKVNGGIDQESAKRFLSAYHKVFTLSHDEIAQLEYVLRRNRLRLLVWTLRRYTMTANESAYKLFCATMSWFDWLETEGRTILRNLARINSLS